SRHCDHRRYALSGLALSGSANGRVATTAAAAPAAVRAGNERFEGAHYCSRATNSKNEGNGAGRIAERENGLHRRTRGRGRQERGPRRSYAEWTDTAGQAAFGADIRLVEGRGNEDR